MATKRSKKAGKVADQSQDQAQQTDEVKGYAGTGDYTSGKFTSSDPGQATDQQIKEQRKAQREAE